MSDPIQTVIDQALEKIQGLEQQIAPITAQITELRITVNSVCKLAGREPLFPDVHASAVAGNGNSATPDAPLAIKNDLFVGKPLATAAKMVLDLRYKRAGTTSPASVDEIHAALVAGGFEFPTRDVENQKRGLAVSLAKNSYTFRRLNNGLFGAIEWYPGAKKARKSGDAAAEDGGDDNADNPEEAAADADAVSKTAQ